MNTPGDLVERLFWVHEDMTDEESATYLDAPKEWRDHTEVLESVHRSTHKETTDLVFLCMDLTVQFARTCGAVLGWEAVRNVMSDAEGRGWKASTERSKTVRPTLQAIPADAVLLPWALDDPRTHPQPNPCLRPSDEELLWKCLLEEEPPITPEEDASWDCAAARVSTPASSVRLRLLKGGRSAGGTRHL